MASTAPVPRPVPMAGWVSQAGLTWHLAQAHFSPGTVLIRNIWCCQFWGYVHLEEQCFGSEHLRQLPSQGFQVVNSRPLRSQIVPLEWRLCLRQKRKGTLKTRHTHAHTHTWVCVKIKPAGGPHCLVFGSICQGSILGTYF